MSRGGTHEQRSLIEQGSEPNDAVPFLPQRRTLGALREAAAGCRGCHLWRGATQTVFGERLKRARVVFVGEQPGDRSRHAEREAFTADLRLVADVLA